MSLIFNSVNMLLAQLYTPVLIDTLISSIGSSLKLIQKLSYNPLLTEPRMVC